MALPLIDCILRRGERVAVIDAEGKYTYASLLVEARAVASFLLGSRDDLEERRIALMAVPGRRYAAALYGIWMAGGVAVPLCIGHPTPELQFVLRNSGAATILADEPHAARAHAAAPQVHALEKMITHPARAVPAVSPRRRALMVYTSGTTSRPKGVVMTYAGLEAMIAPLIAAWGWKASDRILHVLPLHHVHGIINALLCCLWVGAACEMLPRFESSEVWQRFKHVTLFMAVPTMYRMLLEVWRCGSQPQRRDWAKWAAGLRLMVSGSAALPKSLFDEWQSVTGQQLLERYGTTETGMVLSNPLEGERRRGTVGQPLPGVDVRIVRGDGTRVEGEGLAGELQVRGPSVFLEYWGHEEATRQAFCDGWYCTGDMALMEDGYYRILGRSAVDVIKTGGYKVFAPEIENVLSMHPCVDECAVVGVADALWGERVCAAVVVRTGCTITAEAMRQWAKVRIAGYKAPSRVRFVRALPRNLMGKVHKPTVRRMLAGD